MEPLIVLITTFTLALFILRMPRKEFKWALAARVAMSAMLVFTAIGHFIYAPGMAMMIPGFIPFKVELVYFTAFIEIAAAIGLHIPKYRKLTGWMLILFF